MVGSALYRVVELALVPEGEQPESGSLLVLHKHFSDLACLLNLAGLCKLQDRVEGRAEGRREVTVVSGRPGVLVETVPLPPSAARFEPVAVQPLALSSCSAASAVCSVTHAAQLVTSERAGILLFHLKTLAKDYLCRL